MNTRKTPLLAGLLGNALEWYDFILYANFATIIARLFFPNENPTVALLLTFGIFASSFLVRPLGAVLFGYIGDHLGRRIALITSISLMSVPTLLIGFLPTYASTGIAAPIFLLILRLLQGIAISGELNSAATFLVEHAKKNRRGLAGSLVMGTVFFGALIGAALSTLLTVILTPEALASWGWRLLFVLGGLAGVTGLIVRLRMQESARFLSQKETAKRLPLSYVFVNYPKQMCIAIALTSIMAVGNHTIFAYVMTFLVKFTHLTTEQANIINLLGFVVIVLL
nr:MFS transporter [Gammaproteobacteria bacterium]